ncbi:MAG TPA: TetR family transcriptional regulator [Ktedonobacterales bacterium]|nr:TetR family transcriptional regulator [Ktedonobacterales bacterium]
MPRSTAHKARTRTRIIEAAARAFRERGVETVAIADVMRAAGLTHGGFYAHFPSKDALVAEATTRGLRDSRRAFVADAADASPDAPLREIIRRYVSRYHRDHPAEGCAMPALAAEIAREPGEIRHAFTTALEEFVTQLADYVPDATPGARRDAALALASGMAGAVALARAVDDPDLSDRILLAARHFYTNTLTGPTPAAGAAATPDADGA